VKPQTGDYVKKYIRKLIFPSKQSHILANKQTNKQTNTKSSNKLVIEHVGVGIAPQPLKM
jgi:hypothetical protein